MIEASVMRIKIRNCIRPNTFRYHVYNVDMTDLWQKLQQQFGNSRQFGDLDLYEIDSPFFLIRAIMTEATLTLIKKKGSNPQQINTFHQLIGFEGS